MRGVRGRQCYAKINEKWKWKVLKSLGIEKKSVRAERMQGASLCLCPCHLRPMRTGIGLAWSSDQVEHVAPPNNFCLYSTQTFFLVHTFFAARCLCAQVPLKLSLHLDLPFLFNAWLFLQFFSACMCACAFASVIVASCLCTYLLIHTTYTHICVAHIYIFLYTYTTRRRSFWNNIFGFAVVTRGWGGSRTLVEAVMNESGVGALAQVPMYLQRVACGECGGFEQGWRIWQSFSQAMLMQRQK